MAEMGKLDHLEERLRAIEGGEDYAFANLKELFLVPNIITPPKSKVLDFDKYKGTIRPKNHLKMYCRKMGAYTKDEELLIHFFQESLTGVAVTWYTNLEPSRRWRDLAAQVALPMTDLAAQREDHNNSRHITSVLLGKMVGYVPSSFADLVFADERIEVGLKRGKFNHPAWTNEKTVANEEGENEGETHAVTAIPIRPSSPPAHHHHYSANISHSHYPPAIYP